MLERIREILSTHQLSSTQFADAIGVSRPIVSHILSGRNKPSLEVVQKIIAAFPDISLQWLLSGAGAMDTKEATKAPIEAPQRAVRATEQPGLAKPAESPAKSRKKPDEGFDASLGISAPVVSDPQDAERTVKAEPLRTPTSPLKDTIVPAPPVDNLTVAKAFAEPGKKIKRIVIFYQDGTFSDYKPE